MRLTWHHAKRYLRSDDYKCVLMAFVPIKAGNWAPHRLNQSEMKRGEQTKPRWQLSLRDDKRQEYPARNTHNSGNCTRTHIFASEPLFRLFQLENRLMAGPNSKILLFRSVNFFFFFDLILAFRCPSRTLETVGRGSGGSPSTIASKLIPNNKR